MVSLLSHSSTLGRREDSICKDKNRRQRSNLRATTPRLHLPSYNIFLAHLENPLRIWDTQRGAAGPALWRFLSCFPHSVTSFSRHLIPCLPHFHNLILILNQPKGTDTRTNKMIILKLEKRRGLIRRLGNLTGADMIFSHYQETIYRLYANCIFCKP